MLKRLQQTAHLVLFLVYAWNVGVLAPAHQHLTSAAAACDHESCGHEHSHACHHGHSHDHHEHGAEHDHEGEAPSAPESENDSHNCPVCQHLSLAAHFEQPALDLPPAGCVWFSAPPQVAAPFCETYGIARSRAPPACA